eukprot:378102_1
MTHGEEEELNRLKDQREKEEFIARMRKKDLERKHALTEEQLERLVEEERRKALQYGDKKQMERARIISERIYKQKRVEQQAIMFEQRIRDEEEDFGHDNDLTYAEREKMKIDKKVLNVVHDAIENRQDDSGGYYIPSAYDRTNEGLLDKKARENIMRGRYKEDEELRNGSYKHEQEKWEDSRIRDALGDINNDNNYNLISDKWAAKAEKEKDQYDTILDDQIQFIVDTMKHGKDLEKELKEQIEEDDKLKL